MGEAIKGSHKGGNTYLFTTRRGYIGLSIGRSGIMVGDRLYFLTRGEIPFALRFCLHPTRDLVFTLVSECYVDGIMDGQAIGPVDLSSKGHRQDELRRKLFGGHNPDPLLPLTEWKDLALV